MADVKVEIVEVNPTLNVNAENVIIEVSEQNVQIDLGITGPQGPRGTGILNGVGAPLLSTGIVGDFYLNVDNMYLYGPKTQSDWGTPIDLVGNTELGYVHTQTVPLSTWTVSHNLGFIPNVTVVDDGGNVVEGSYSYPNPSTTVLLFNGVFSGKAYFS
jgi:hypothetical protein